MATITLTLNATQARATRRYILFWHYPAAAREFGERLDGLPLDHEEEIAAIPEAKGELIALERLVEQIGWEPITVDEIELTGEEEVLRQYVAGAFEEAREHLGEGGSDQSPADVLREDARYLAEAQALLPLLERLHPEEVAS